MSQTWHTLLLEPESWPLTLLPEQHELQHPLQLLYKLLNLGLCAVIQPTGPSQPESMQALRAQAHRSLFYSTSAWGGYGSGDMAAGMVRGQVGIGGIQSKEIMRCQNDLLALAGEGKEPRDWSYETGEQNPGTPREEGTPGKRLGTLFPDHWGPEGSDPCKFCG